MTKLPAGFAYITDKQKAAVTFENKYARFYLSQVFFNNVESVVRGVSRIDIAYNKATKEILFDLKGNTFKIDQRGYITSNSYARLVQRAFSDFKKDKISFHIDKEKSNDRFICMYIDESSD